MKRELTRLLIAALGAFWALSAAAAEGTPETDAEAAEEAPLDVETILSGSPSAEDYGEIQRCLFGRYYDHVEMLDEHHMLFEGRKRVWLNRLRGRCAIRSDSILVLEQHSSSACSSDRVTGYTRGTHSMPTGFCILGEFQEIDAQQAALLKESVEADRQAKSQAAKQRRKEARQRREKEAS